MLNSICRRINDQPTVLFPAPVTNSTFSLQIVPLITETLSCDTGVCQNDITDIKSVITGN